MNRKKTETVNSIALPLQPEKQGTVFWDALHLFGILRMPHFVNQEEKGINSNHRSCGHNLGVDRVQNTWPKWS